MPDQVSIALYSVEDLPVPIKMIQDIFSKTATKTKAPDLFVAQTTQPWSTTQSKDSNASTPTVTFDSANLLGIELQKFTAATEQLTDTLNKQGPYKLNIRGSYRGRGRGRNNSRGRGGWQGYRNRSNSRGRYNYRGRGRSHSNNRFRGNRSQSRDNGRCFNCHQFGHWAREYRNTHYNQNTTGSSSQQIPQNQNSNSQTHNQNQRQSRPRERQSDHNNRLNSMEFMQYSSHFDEDVYDLNY